MTNWSYKMIDLVRVRDLVTVTTSGITYLVLVALGRMLMVSDRGGRARTVMVIVMVLGLRHSVEGFNTSRVEGANGGRMSAGRYVFGGGTQVGSFFAGRYSLFKVHKVVVRVVVTGTVVVINLIVVDLSAIQLVAVLTSVLVVGTISVDVIVLGFKIVTIVSVFVTLSFIVNGTVDVTVEG